MRDHVLIYINGERHEVRGDDTRLMLADFLRYRRGLTGTKIVCAEGDCGACTVLRQAPHSAGKASSAFVPLNSCIAMVAQMDGSNLVTVEALSDLVPGKRLSPVQAEMVGCHGSQCGYCTPGFVMALTGLVEKRLACGNREAIGKKEAQNYLTGNLCRCTGYEPILEAAAKVDLKECQALAGVFAPAEVKRALRAAAGKPFIVEGEFGRIYAPTTLREAAKFLRANPNARLLGAGTDVGMQANKGRLEISDSISLHLVKELYGMAKRKSRVRVGARVTLSELRRAIAKDVPEFARFLDLFASPQIKNVATLVGNVANASPIADTPPFLLVCEAELHLLGPKGARRLALTDFFLGYRKTALRPGEFITAVEFTVPAKGERLRLYKTSQRKDLDIACVNAAFRLSLDKDQRVKSTRLALGGVAGVPLQLTKTEKLLTGKNLAPELVEAAVASLQSEIRPLSDLRGSAAFRRVLAGNYFRQFLREALA